MSNLIGSGANQVPTNSHLGKLAYMDKLNIDAYNETVNVPATTLSSVTNTILHSFDDNGVCFVYVSGNIVSNQGQYELLVGDHSEVQPSGVFTWSGLCSGPIDVAIRWGVASSINIQSLTIVVSELVTSKTKGVK